MTSPLVSTEWLAQHLDDPNVRVIDASWYLPDMKRDHRAEYETQHIPGAVFFDIDALSDHNTTLPHMMPPVAELAGKFGALGIGDEDFVVAYDGHGLFSAARPWWMLRALGHDKVAVLDGGLPKWLADGHRVESGAQAVPAPKSFVADFRPHLVRDLRAVKAVSENGGETLVDARAAGRFEGIAPEMWANGRRGHIPTARNLPFTDLIDPISKTLLPLDQLREKLAAAGLGDGPITASCGSGVTACVIALALNEIGRPDVAVYDGSWAEWGLRTELPAATGPA